MLNKFNYPAPWLQIAFDPVLGQPTVWLLEDTPGLNYVLQSINDLINDPWFPSPVSGTDTNAIWSATDDFNPPSASIFYNVATTPVPGTSPPRPNGSGGP